MTKHSNNTTRAITRALVQQNAFGGQLEPEHEAVRKELESRGVQITLFSSLQELQDWTEQELVRKNSHCCLVVGDHDAIKKALQSLNKALPEASSYPPSIRDFLKRNIRQTCVRDLKRAFSGGPGGVGLSQPVFVKPAQDTKSFTGFVLSSEADFHKMQGASRKTKIHVSNVVSFRAEYRVFVLYGKIIGVKNYQGDHSLSIDMDVVESCIHMLEVSEEATCAYGIDFGVLDTGETALVEWNDGFALGSYGLEPKLYASMLIARWQEIMTDGDEVE